MAKGGRRIYRKANRSKQHSADFVSDLLLLKLSNELFYCMLTCYLNCEDSVLVVTKVTRLCNKLYEESIIIAIVSLVNVS
jgi:hypothetical protein